MSFFVGKFLSNKIFDGYFDDYPFDKRDKREHGRMWCLCLYVKLLALEHLTSTLLALLGKLIQLIQPFILPALISLFLSVKMNFQMQ